VYAIVQIMANAKADTVPATDGGESVALMEPMLVSESGDKRNALADIGVPKAQEAF
jgi:hypothetical protein